MQQSLHLATPSHTLAAFLPEKKLKVLLINPRKGWRPAVGLLYLASYVRHAGHEVRVLEFQDETFYTGDNQDVWDALYEYDPDVIGLGIISWNRSVALAIIDRIRSTTTNKTIICGNRDPNYKPGIYLDRGVDYVVAGEGEETLLELLDAIQHERDATNIQGIVYKDGDKLRHTPLRETKPVKEPLFPAFDLVDYEHYCNIRLGGIPGHYIKTGFIMASRGCPYKCRFCADPMRTGYRPRTVENLVDEIKWQVKNWGVKGIVFMDDIFFFNDKQMNKFCNRILEEGLNLKFFALTRVDRIGSLETLKLMKKAGFIQLALGIESGSQRMLDIMQKDITLDQARSAVQKIHQAGIHTFVFMILGFPEETVEDLEESVNFLREIKPTFVTTSFFMPMPGTDYFDSTNEESLDNLSFSFTENQEKFFSKVSKEDIYRYNSMLLATSQRNKELNLLRYPSFYLWIFKTCILHFDMIVKGLYQQKKKRLYTSYIESVRMSLVGAKILYG